MMGVGQVVLLGAFVASGYASFACVHGSRQRNSSIVYTGVVAGCANLTLLTVCVGILLYALVVRDFRFAYVAQYTSRSLPWKYAVASLWVGQAGSLLLWSWFTAALSMAFWSWPRRERNRLLDSALGIVLGFCFFLNAIMVFTTDPMQASDGLLVDGAGLSPVLQHPAMLFHPPIVFLAYSFWCIPCALALAGLAHRRLDAAWLAELRPWLLVAWALLGSGILYGAQWAYTELGWGGYWAWDPVENGSLMPWLLGTAALHACMVWRFRGTLKKTALVLLLATFGMCIFATFLTRSGIFSSLHAFSQSSIGWLFLAILALLALAGAYLLLTRRSMLERERAITTVWSREAFIVLSTGGLVLLTVVILFGTLAPVISEIAIGRKIIFGAEIYQQALLPISVLVVGACGISPLIRWGKPPTKAQTQVLLGAAGMGVFISLISIGSTTSWLWHLMLALVAMGGLAVLGTWYLDAARLWSEVTKKNVTNSLAASTLQLTFLTVCSRAPWLAAWRVLRQQRRRYAGYLIHLGFFAIVLGVTASSLGTQQDEATLRMGESYSWNGRQVRLQELRETETPDKLIAAALLKIYEGPTELLLEPAQHFHWAQREWTTEVAIHSNGRRDLYVILHGADEAGARLTLVENPMIGWMWWGGVIMVLGTIAAAWPDRTRRRQQLRIHDQETCQTGTSEPTLTIGQGTDRGRAA